MNDKAVILCVDDEPINISILEELLLEAYEVVSTDSGSACLQSVEQAIPDLILLDVNMPRMDGLETCRRLKQVSQFAEIPIIFVSALASDGELMAGYEAGGDDYITKPFSGEILQKKIEVVLASQRRRQELRAISDNAVEALQENRSSSGELALVVKFLQESFTIDSLSPLATRVFECLADFKLDCSLLILAEPENLFWFSDDIDRPMERQILLSLHGQDHVVSFGTRLAINSEKATILIRNIPQDEEKSARLRDLMSILIEGLATRIRDLQSEASLRSRQAQLSVLLDASRYKLQQISEQRQKQSLVASELLSRPGGVIERSRLQMELTGKQQGQLNKAIKSVEQQIGSIYQDACDIDEQIEKIIEELKSALEFQV